MEVGRVSRQGAAPIRLLSSSQMDAAGCEAAANGCITALADLLERAQTPQGEAWTPGRNQCMVAAAAGQTAVLEWLRSHVKFGAWDSAVCTAAARANQLEALRWLQTTFAAACPCNVYTMDAAAERGHLDILKFLLWRMWIA